VDSSEVPAGAPDDPQDWRAGAFQAGANWLLVDPALRVIAMSDPAREFFGEASLPASLVALTHSVAMESLARRCDTRPEAAEIDLAHQRRLVRVRASRVAAEGCLLWIEDITELRRLEAMRADFVANLAHELRTPVASLSLAAETLASDLPPLEHRRFVDRISEETRYIEGLLRSVSELALLENDVPLNVSEFVLAEAIEETWRRVTDRQGDAALDSAVGAQVLVTADRVRVLEILQNLLENAHRFSPSGGAVRVGAQPTPGGTLVWVEDDGPGIPPADLPRVFERFYKVDRARTRRGDGSGLGLAIAKHLVSAHGGRIWAEAAASGGTRISFTLLIADAPPVPG